MKEETHRDKENKWKPILQLRYRYKKRSSPAEEPAGLDLSIRPDPPVRPRTFTSRGTLRLERCIAY